jgi:two-component system capsular synthesis sensor histidine kinase RcsC
MAPKSVNQQLTSAVGDPNGVRILVVEDDAQFRALVRDMLEDDGYAVTPVQDGLEAVATMDREGFDLVITDLLMPRMNGLQLLMVVRERWPHVPVIAITAWGDPRLVSESQAHGAVTCLQKPFTMQSLKHAVQEVCHDSGRKDHGEEKSVSS